MWSTNNARALAIAERIQAGSVWINDAHQINCQLPFGGYKQSGLRPELGPDALDAYTEVKTVRWTCLVAVPPSPTICSSATPTAEPTHQRRFS